MQKCDYLSKYFYRLEIILFIEKTPKHYFKIIFAQKQKIKKIYFFDKNHGLTPFENMKK